MVTIDITLPSGETKRHTFDDEAVSIGRMLGQVRLQDPGISALHGQLTVEDGEVSYRDLGSAQGSFLPDGTPIRYTVSLQRGDKVRLGEHQLALVEFGQAPPPPPEPAPAGGAPKMPEPTQVPAAQSGAASADEAPREPAASPSPAAAAGESAEPGPAVAADEPGPVAAAREPATAPSRGFAARSRTSAREHAPSNTPASAPQRKGKLTPSVPDAPATLKRSTLSHAEVGPPPDRRDTQARIRALRTYKEELIEHQREISRSPDKSQTLQRISNQHTKAPRPVQPHRAPAPGQTFSGQATSGQALPGPSTTGQGAFAQSTSGQAAVGHAMPGQPSQPLQPRTQLSPDAELSPTPIRFAGRERKRPRIDPSRWSKNDAAPRLASSLSLFGRYSAQLLWSGPIALGLLAVLCISSLLLFNLGLHFYVLAFAVAFFIALRGLWAWSLSVLSLFCQQPIHALESWRRARQVSGPQRKSLALFVLALGALVLPLGILLPCALPVFVLEEKGPVIAAKRSLELLQKHPGNLGLPLAATLICAVLTIAGVATLHLEGSATALMLVLVLGTAATSWLAGLTSLHAFRIYFWQRHQEDHSAPELRPKGLVS